MRGHIKQRAKGSYSISIYLGIDTITKKKKYKWYTVHGTKKDAEKFLTEKLNEIDNGIFVDSKDMTLETYLNYWYNQCCVPNLSPTTYESYKRNIDTHIIPCLGNIKLKDLKPLHLQSFYTNRLESPLSKTSVKYLHRILHCALNQAQKWQLVSINVADCVDAPKPEKYVATTLTPDQITLLIDAVKNTNIYLPVIIAISTGMRRGEVLGLTWENIDIKNSIIRITQTLLPTKNGLQILPPKTQKSNRIISMPPTLKNILAEYKEKTSCKFVCYNEFDELINPSYLNHKFKQILEDNNLPKVRFHDLRHSHASLLLSQGVHAKVISERLGHSNISITMDLYSHVYDATNIEVANNFDTFINKKIS